MKNLKLKRWVAGSLFGMIGLMQLGMQETGGVSTLVRLQLTDYPAQMKQIQKFEFDVAGVNLDQKTVDLIVSPAELQTLQDSGFQVLNDKNMARMLGPDHEYQTPEKVAQVLKSYQAAYPNLAQVSVVGQSLEGRDIFAIKITGQVKQNNPAKPRILFNGMHHAREVMSVEVPLDTIDQLLTQYGKDPKITHWVDTNEIWVLPMFNVDGNQKVWSHDSMWRKNTRDGHGVDLNRNYPYGWASCNGSSSRTGAQDYHGASAGSEPETQVMMKFVSQIRPVFDISYHSASELVIYPYGCGDHVPTKDVLETIGKEMGKKIVSDNGRGSYQAGTAPELLYTADGGDIDWMYHEFQVNPYVIELNSTSQGFQPSYSRWRNDTVKRVRPAWQYLLDLMDGPAITGLVSNSAGKSVQGAVLHIERVSKEGKFVQDYRVQESGYFHVILPRGQFQVTIQAPGFEPRVQTVNVETVKVQVSAALSQK
jgi:carboxypeptidase T